MVKHPHYAHRRYTKAGNGVAVISYCWRLSVFVSLQVPEETVNADRGEDDGK